MVKRRQFYFLDPSLVAQKAPCPSYHTWWMHCVGRININTSGWCSHCFFLKCSHIWRHHSLSYVMSTPQDYQLSSKLKIVWQKNPWCQLMSYFHSFLRANFNANGVIYKSQELWIVSNCSSTYQKWWHRIRAVRTWAAFSEAEKFDPNLVLYLAIIYFYLFIY